MFRRKFLIIWQSIPEDTYLHLYDCLSKEEADKIELCNGHHLNLDGNSEEVEDAITWLDENILSTSNRQDISLPLHISDNYTVILTGMVM